MSFEGKASLWEKYCDQLNDIWPIEDFEEFKVWYERCVIITETK